MLLIVFTIQISHPFNVYCICITLTPCNQQTFCLFRKKATLLSNMGIFQFVYRFPCICNILYVIIKKKYCKSRIIPKHEIEDGTM